MSLNPRVLLRLAALALPVLLVAGAAAARDPRPAMPPVSSTNGLATPGSNIPQAPVGHRQPRAADIPANAPKHESDAWLQRLNRQIDRKLQICRGC